MVFAPQYLISKLVILYRTFDLEVVFISVQYQFRKIHLSVLVLFVVRVDDFSMGYLADVLDADLLRACFIYAR